MICDLYGNDTSKAIDATISFFESYLRESNTIVSPFIQRIMDRRRSEGKEPKSPKINSDEDIQRFLVSMRELLNDRFQYRERIVFMVDYSPMFELDEVISNSEIEDKRAFVHRAKFMSKLKITITHNRVSMSDGGKNYPDIWVSE